MPAANSLSVPPGEIYPLAVGATNLTHFCWNAAALKHSGRVVVCSLRTARE